MKPPPMSDTLPPVTESATLGLPSAWPRLVQRGLLGLLIGCAGLQLAGIAGLALAGAVDTADGVGLALLGLLVAGLAGLATTAARAWRQATVAAGSGPVPPFPGLPVALVAGWVGGVLVLAALSAAALGLAGALLALPLLGAALCLAVSQGQPRLALASGVAVLLLVMGGWLALQQGRLAPQPVAPWLVPLVLAGVLGGAAWLGRLLAALAQQQRQLALRQVQRWQAMRRLATDVCWEADATLRIRSLAWRNRHGRLMPLTDDYLGQRPWDMAVLGMDDNTQDLLRACVDARDRIQDLPVAWRCPDGRRRHYLISGEPDADADGRFIGYWGVARDVSAERTARQAMQSATWRYQRLFRRLPVPMVLHRDGHVLEANEAAAQLLGYEQPAAMEGRDLLHEHMDEEQREMALDRLDELDADPGLVVLPVVPRRLLRCDGRPVFTLASDLRSEHGGRPAVVSVLLDESARHGALQAQHRGDTLMNRVLSLSPDIVALCTLEDGRCVQVNDSLARVLGLARTAWVGPAATGPWRSGAELERLTRLVQAQGVVRDLPLAFDGADGEPRALLVTATVVVLDDVRYLLFNARPAPAEADSAPAMAEPSWAGAA
jgi:PAS domain S-box-containing protein